MRRIAALLFVVFAGIVLAQSVQLTGPGGILTYDTGAPPSGTPITSMRTSKWYVNNARIPRGATGIDFDDSLGYTALQPDGSLTPATASGITRPALCNQPWTGAAGVNKATFVGSIAGTTLTVSSLTTGTIVPGSPAGHLLRNLAPIGPTRVGIRILSQLTGTTGGAGTYLLDTSTTSASGAMESGTNGCQRNAGNFRTICAYAKMSNSDPIVLPGRAGASHLHTFFGNTGVDAWSTNDGGTRSITNHGNAGCGGGTLNRSAYWIPTLIYHCPIGGLPAGCDQAKDGTPILPAIFAIYYKGMHGDGSFINDGTRDNEWSAQTANDIQSFPAGFRMLGGVPTSTSGQTGIVHFTCRTYGDVDFHIGDHIPGTGVGATDTCTAAEAAPALMGKVRMSISFPSCWVPPFDLDSPTHNAHVVYPPCAVGAKQLTGISYQVDFYFTSQTTSADGLGLQDMKFWRLTSDNYPDTQPAGYSAHGDWFNGWNQSIMDRWVLDCLRTGIDCHDNLAGVYPTNVTNPPTIWRLLRNPRQGR